MKDNTAKHFRAIVALLAFLLLNNYIFSQDFKPQPLITIPGKNTNVNVISAQGFSKIQSDTYICWQNQDDSLYSIYLKRIVPFDSNNVKIFSSVYPSIKPSIWKDDWEQQDATIQIAWQSLVNNHWQIKSAIFKNGVVGNVLSITDSLTNNTDPIITRHEIVWIKDSNLVIAPLDSANFKMAFLDSGECANPCMQRSYSDVNIIAYEKGGMQNKQISLVKKWDYPASSWQKMKITSEGYNKNPRFGPSANDYIGALSFESLVKNVWKVIYSEYPYLHCQDTTRNNNCNYNNPEFLTYGRINSPAFKRTSFPHDGFLLAFDSDSVFSGREVFVKYFSNNYLIADSPAVNISSMQGDDIKPRIFLINDYGINSVIMWEHIEGENTQLWYAKNNYKYPQNVENDHSILSGYSLSQNYPNPFNPSTKIRYTIPSLCHVKLQIFDLLGNEIALLVDETKPQGSYEAELNAGDFNLSSGIYFYRIQAGKFFETKKLVLLK